MHDAVISAAHRAEVSRIHDYFYVRVCCGNLSENVNSTVGGGVITKDVLPAIALEFVIKKSSDSFVTFDNSIFLIKAGSYDADRLVFHRVHSRHFSSGIWFVLISRKITQLRPWPQACDASQPQVERVVPVEVRIVVGIDERGG